MSQMIYFLIGLFLGVAEMSVYTTRPGVFGLCVGIFIGLWIAAFIAGLVWIKYFKSSICFIERKYQ